MQKINLCKRSQVITRYALIDLSLIYHTLNSMKLTNFDLSNFDLSSATKLFCILQNFIFFQKCVVCHPKTVRKNLVGYQGYPSGNPVSVRRLSSGIPFYKNCDYSKTAIPCSWYSVTFTKTYLQSFCQTFLMLNKIVQPPPPPPPLPILPHKL